MRWVTWAWPTQTLGEARKAIELMEAALDILEQIESPYAEQARAKLAELKAADDES